MRVQVTHFYMGARHWFAGAWDDALAEIDAGLTATDEQGRFQLRFVGAALALSIAAHRGDRTRSESMLRLMASAEDASDIWIIERWFMGHSRGIAAWLDGDLSTALDRLRPAWGLVTIAGAVGQYRLIGPDFVRLLVESGDSAEAAEVTSCVQEAADRAGGIPSADGAALRCSGLVDGNAGLLLEAVERYRASPRVFERACTIEDAGAAVCADERDRGVELLLEARASYEALGAIVDVRRVESRLRDMGVRFGVRGSRVRPTTGWESLTPKEHDVVRLVCDGLTNREVGERLYVSTRTVDSHVAHIFQKLGVRSRAELATQYAVRS